MFYEISDAKLDGKPPENPMPSLTFSSLLLYEIADSVYLDMDQISVKDFQ